jgi:hypothetical protein
MKYYPMERTMKFEELGIVKLEKTIDEMTTKEAKEALKIVNKNIKILTKAISKHETKLAALELKEKVAKATSDKPIVKSSNAGTGKMTPTMNPTAAKPAVKPAAKPVAKPATKPTKK